MRIFRFLGLLLILTNIAAGCKTSSRPPAFRQPLKNASVVTPGKKDIDKLNKKFIKLFREGKYPDAKKVADKAFGAVGKTFGQEHPNMVTPMFNIALTSQALGQDNQAELFYKRTLEILAHVLWPNRPTLKTTEDNLALLYFSRGKHVEARDLYKQAQTILERVFVPEHPDVAISLYKLAVIYKNQGKYTEAELLFKQAIEIWEKTYGEDHTNVKTGLNSLEAMKRNRGHSDSTKTKPLIIGQQDNKVFDSSKIAGSGNPQKGKDVYKKRCVRCHGIKGDGNGPVAKFLNPKPRDFTKGKFKIRTTPTGKLPTDQNLFDTISRGIPGTAMPAWKGVILNKDIADVVPYIKTFSKKFAKWEKKGKLLPEITIGPEVPSSPESIAKGRELFLQLECWKCHGKSGRGSGPSNPDLKDDWGNPIRPANFHHPWNLKGGSSRRAIYTRFNTGLMGTPMPSFADALDNEKSWHLANFVRSLGPEKKPEVNEIIVSRFIEGDIPINYNDPLWRDANKYFFPLVGETALEVRRFWSNINSINISTLHNNREVAFLIEWSDSTKNPILPFELFPKQCSDAFFLQFPSKLIEKPKKPYFFPENKNKGADIWFWESKNMECRESISKQTTLNANAFYDDGRWLLVLKRPMKTSVNGELQFETGKFIPISFHAQDGLESNKERDKFLPTWRWLVLQPGLPQATYLDDKTTDLALKPTLRVLN